MVMLSHKICSKCSGGCRGQQLVEQYAGHNTDIQEIYQQLLLLLPCCCRRCQLNLHQVCAALHRGPQSIPFVTCSNIQMCCRMSQYIYNSMQTHHTSGQMEKAQPPDPAPRPCTSRQRCTTLWTWETLQVAAQHARK